MIGGVRTGAKEREVGLDELRARVERRDVLLVDASTQTNYEIGHLPRALSLPLEDLAARASVAIPSHEAEFIVYCGNAD